MNKHHGEIVSSTYPLIPPAMNELRAIIIDIIDPFMDRREAEQNCTEMVRLIQTLEGIVVVKVLQKRGRPSASTFIGSGKAEEVAHLVKTLNIDVVICNQMLKPTQLLHLQGIIPCTIWDHFDVILQIFSAHAHTQEAKMQVELARMKNEFPRIHGKGIEMSQIVGGKKGATRGPGEQFLEMRKRHLRGRIDELEKKLNKLKRSRRIQNEQRTRKNFFHIALVGYMNSGKSSLLSTMTKKKNVYIADELFATLDTRIGSLYLPTLSQKVVMSDTIGFISNLPPVLISSFLATLEAVKQADLLLHVIDSSDANTLRNIDVVNTILTDLQCDQKLPILYNKSDLITKTTKKHIKEFLPNAPYVFTSAITKEGLELLKDKIIKFCNKISHPLYI